MSKPETTLGVPTEDLVVGVTGDAQGRPDR